MPLMSTRCIQKEIQNTGNTCTITEISKSVGSDEYRIISETPTVNSNISCFVQILNESDDIVKQGNSRSGELIFWFDSSQESLCVQGNRITFDSKTLEMVDVRKYDILGTTQIIEVRTSQF